MAAESTQPEGGVVYPQPLHDVEMFPALVPSGMAYHAARTALSLYRRSDSLPFVEFDPEHPDILHVGWSKPINDHAGSNTIFEHPQTVKRAQSLIGCAKTLIDAAYPDFTPGHISLLFDEEGSRPRHQDMFNGSRALLLLAGAKLVEFDHVPHIARTELMQFPGDAYKMQFRNDETGLWHEVDSFLPMNVALYAQEVN
jgi:hypothetical protein